MIPFMDSKEEVEKCLDSQLWHACAGGMVQMPGLNSLVYYFPQGHAEHATGNLDFRNIPRLPAYVLCRVLGIKFMAEKETDEVYAKIRLVSVKGNEREYDENTLSGFSCIEGQEKLASFAKTLTQSDANNGGGFSVPRYCAETIFPRLDYSEDPPVQTILVKDVHGEIWKFRHIYRGTPRRHLLTTGWSTFVSQKKLVAGDSIVFLRAESEDLCVGIRRAKRGIFVEPQLTSGWNTAGGNFSMPYGGLLSSFLQDGENKLLGNGDCTSSGVVKGTVRAEESVLEAARLAADGQPFEVVYFPRASTPEFCVSASKVNAALRIRWCSGMRFKMPFETEDSSRISWFMGTISSVQIADPNRWPNSPWRLLQVSWDEPDLLQNVKRVSPWLVELVSNMPAIHLSHFFPPRKKLRLSHPADFQMNGQLPMRTFSGSLLGPGSPFSSLDTVPAGMQGARHAPFGVSSYLSPSLFPPVDHSLKPLRDFSCLSTNQRTNTDEDGSCSLTIGTSASEVPKLDETKTSHFVLFGKTIFTEQKISASCSVDAITSSNNDFSDGYLHRTQSSSVGSGSAWQHQEASLLIKTHFPPETAAESDCSMGTRTGPCKIFIETDEGVGTRTLDLSQLSSYEDLCKRLDGLVGKEISKTMSQFRYQDKNGAVKKFGDEQFSDFINTARQLFIGTDSSANMSLETLQTKATTTSSS